MRAEASTVSRLHVKVSIGTVSELRPHAQDRGAPHRRIDCYTAKRTVSECATSQHLAEQSSEFHFVRAQVRRRESPFVTRPTRFRLRRGASSVEPNRIGHMVGSRKRTAKRELVRIVDFSFLPFYEWGTTLWGPSGDRRGIPHCRNIEKLGGRGMGVVYKAEGTEQASARNAGLALLSSARAAW